MTERAGPVILSTTGSGSVWLATPADASTPTNHACRRIGVGRQIIGRVLDHERWSVGALDA
jgi:hypothetical protein